MYFEIIIIALLGLTMANNSAFGIGLVISCMQNLCNYTNLHNRLYLPARLSSQYMCSCVSPSCYLIFELHIRVNYDYVEFKNQIDQNS